MTNTKCQRQNVKIDPDLHYIAKCKAVTLKISLQKYLESLILKDSKEQKQT